MHSRPGYAMAGAAFCFAGGGGKRRTSRLFEWVRWRLRRRSNISFDCRWSASGGGTGGYGCCWTKEFDAARMHWSGELVFVLRGLLSWRARRIYRAYSCKDGGL
ncbi:hypothetical protein KL86DPRO_11368 [uncultured delta proteobacterium]|uniref:Uncharacterized protein n=1 Tax=uncultured delta proteobacterium TaxID=34034 RepID=A0A212JFY5_9DELT|nr:hypothetical protein KL86DPRO_11368 [uncultured delta proteobacterium]